MRAGTRRITRFFSMCSVQRPHVVDGQRRIEIGDDTADGAHHRRFGARACVRTWISAMLDGRSRYE